MKTQSEQRKDCWKRQQVAKLRWNIAARGQRSEGRGRIRRPRRRSRGYRMKHLKRRWTHMQRNQRKNQRHWTHMQRRKEA